jgi:hypothetical protein
LHIISELNMLLRVRVELPEGYRIATHEFQEGWNFSQSVNVSRLEKEILHCGWNFIQIGNGPQSYGVGDTSQEAIGNALVHALRRIREDCNAVEVERIELTEHPWFFLAKVGVFLYRIQQVATLTPPDHVGWHSATPARKRSPRQSAVLFPQSDCAMPMLKEMLILSRSTHERAQ